MGILNIYRFLRDTGREEEPAWLAEAMRGDTPPATIADAARNRKVPLCVRTIKLFVKLYGDEAGDLALKIMATGGLYVAGGPARKNLDFLTDGTFLAAFNAKGRMRRLMQSMPVRVILTDQASLIGAAHCAVLRQRNP